MENINRKNKYDQNVIAQISNSETFWQDTAAFLTQRHRLTMAAFL